MVFADLSAPEARPKNKNATSVLPIAFVWDRTLALLLDFLIFSPIISLLLAGFVKQAKTFFLLDPQSPEGLMLGTLIFVMGITAVVLLQSAFLYYWQATPGQLFMQMRVISYPHMKVRLTFAQCFVRSFLWCCSFLALAIPFLEVLSHPLRRAFHERASDTFVMTLKQEPDEGPHYMEERFVASWMRMSFLFIALLCAVSFFKSLQSIQVSLLKDKLTGVPVCKEMRESELQGVERLDAAVSLFLLNEISAECLNKEAEASLWGDPVNAQDLAYLAKYLITDSDEQEKYFEKVCHDQTSSACLIASYMNDNSEKEKLANVDAKLWVGKVLQVDEKYTQREILSSLELIEELQQEPSLKAALEKKYVRSIWALRDSAKGASGRRPASTSTKSKIEDFKEKYGIQ